jgi:HNH endonuclease
MKEIPLNHGKVALVDDADYERVMTRTWYAVQHKKRWYAKSGFYRGLGKTTTTVYMHRFIFNLPPGRKNEVDHRNGNGLDNQRSNLRVCTSAQNKMNVGLRKDNRSGYKGVGWHSKMKQWMARIRIDGKYRVLGYSPDVRVAAQMYIEAAKTHHGEFARTESFNAH